MGLLDTERVAQRILELARNPSVTPPEEEYEERADVEPDCGEWPFDKSKDRAGNLAQIALKPQKGTLQSRLDMLQNITVWAVDGGALTIELPIGRLIIGRAAIIKMAFYGYETVKRELIVPALPFVVCKGPADKDVPKATALYLTKAIQLIPTEMQRYQTKRPIIDYFSDGEAFLDKFQDSWSGATQSQVHIARAIDIARNAAETIAFQTALKLAKQGDLVLRDGRLHGSVGFWTTLCKMPSEDITSSSSVPQTKMIEETEDVKALNNFVKDVEDAVRRDVRVVGIIKRPVADECCAWLRNNGLTIARYASDAILYLRVCEALPPSEPKFGKRSTLWRYKPYQPQGENFTPRMRLEKFRRSVAFYYLMPGLTIIPFRVDMPTYNDMYQHWYEDVACKIYTLARGSGSPSRIPHPIKIADACARVSHAEVARFLNALITEFESSGDAEAKDLARELRAWIYRGR